MIKENKGLQIKYEETSSWFREQLLKDDFKQITADEYFDFEGISFDIEGLAYKNISRYKEYISKTPVEDSCIVYKSDTIKDCFFDEVYILIFPDEYLTIITGTKYEDLNNKDAGRFNEYIGKLNYLDTFNFICKLKDNSASTLPFIKYFIDSTIILAIQKVNTRRMPVYKAIEDNRDFLK